LYRKSYFPDRANILDIPKTGIKRESNPKVKERLLPLLKVENDGIPAHAADELHRHRIKITNNDQTARSRNDFYMILRHDRSQLHVIYT
jgi:hypothetical protein